MAQPQAVAGRSPHVLHALPVAVALLFGALPASVLAQNLVVTPEQRSTAQQVAQAGVPLGDLAPDAPEQYTVKSGDTLWDIARMYLRTPWRWPELWGMNMQEVRDPHRIYPGQQLVLEKVNGLARLRVGQAGRMDTPPTETVRVSPRTRVEALADMALPTLQPNLIEPFLAEPIIVGEDALMQAPRIVAAQEGRVLITRGDRVYARGLASAPLVSPRERGNGEYRIFRTAQPLRDPVTRAVLGYEAQYLGRAALVRGESTQNVAGRGGGTEATVVPATIDIVSAREEMRVGDRLVPEPPRQLVTYTPRAPQQRVEGAVVSVYGNAVAMAGQNQVVVLNKGTADGLEAGHVLAILRDGERLVDRSQPGERTNIKLPDERNGLLMVFRTFDRLSYALVLEITDGVEIGDRVVNPR